MDLGLLFVSYLQVVLTNSGRLWYRGLNGFERSKQRKGKIKNKEKKQKRKKRHY